MKLQEYDKKSVTNRNLFQNGKHSVLLPVVYRMLTQGRVWPPASISCNKSLHKIFRHAELHVVKAAVTCNVAPSRESRISVQGLV